MSTRSTNLITASAAGPSRAGLAMARAVAFLETRQLPTGEIPVCASGTRDPSIFPTALAAHSVSFEPTAHRVHERALDFLAREMAPRGLWKHWPREHPHASSLPPDLDDTACASAVLAAANRPFPDNRSALLRNRTRDGLFLTWKLGLPELAHPFVLWSFFRSTSASPRDVDAVVNANVTHYLGALPEVIDHLLHVLRNDRESSCDKWYDNPFVVWYFLSRAMHRHAPDAGEMIVAKLNRAVPRTALEHALAACSLRYWEQDGDITPLLDTQLDSGGWPSAPLYHGGRRKLSDDSFANPHPDTPHWGSEELTTAFCIEALAPRAR